MLWVVAWLVATLLLGWFVRSLDLAAVGRVVAGSHVGWLLVAVGANFLALPLMTEQWWRLVPLNRRPPRAAIWECVTLSLAAMNTIPFGGGHALAVGLLARRGGIGLDGGLSVLALEQLCEGFAKLALLLLALSVAPLPPRYAEVAGWLAAGLLVAVLALGWVIRAGGDGAVGWRARWAHHLDSLRRPQAFLAALALSLAGKLAMGLGIFAVQRSLGLELSPGVVVCVLAAVTFGTMISVAPANMLVYEAAALAAYRWFGWSKEEGLALGLLQHVCFLLPMVGTGYGLMLWRWMRPGAGRQAGSST